MFNIILLTLCAIAVQSQNIPPFTNPYLYNQQVLNPDQIYFADDPRVQRPQVSVLPLAVENEANTNQDNYLKEYLGNINIGPLPTVPSNVNTARPPQNVGNPNVGTQNVGTQNVGTQNVGTQNVGAQNVGRPSMNLEPPVMGGQEYDNDDRFADDDEISDKEAVINKKHPPAIKIGPLSRPVTNFGLNLMKGIGQPGQNLVISPFSISTLLSLLQQGSKGATQQQISTALQMPPEVAAAIYKTVTQDVKARKTNNILNLATNLFIADAFQLNPAFKSTARNNFNSEITPTRFGPPERAVNMINNWVASRTNNKITKLVTADSISENTQLVLVNAVYFKGAWDLKFNPDVTQPGPFQLSDKSKTTVPFMRMRRFLRTGIDRSSNAQIVILPFEKEEYSLMVILPSKLSTIAEVLPKLTDSKLLEYHRLPYEETALELPKFTVRADTDLNLALRKLGILNIFSNESELSGVGSFRSYFPQVSSALHSAMLSIDEQGGSAAAATAFAVVALSYDEPNVLFKADRPFIAVLWDSSSGVPLFMATIEDPSS